MRYPKSYPKRNPFSLGTFRNLKAMRRHASKNDMEVRFRYSCFKDAECKDVLGAYAFKGCRIKYLFDVNDNFVRNEH
jgi:hypothetical protein